MLNFLLTSAVDSWNIEWEDGGKIGNTNKLILTEIFTSVHETLYLKVLTPGKFSCATSLRLKWDPLPPNEVREEGNYEGI